MFVINKNRTPRGIRLNPKWLIGLFIYCFLFITCCIVRIVQYHRSKLIVIIQEIKQRDFNDELEIIKIIISTELVWRVHLSDLAASYNKMAIVWKVDSILALEHELKAKMNLVSHGQDD